MANFGKFGNLSKTGWNEAKTEQVIGVGNNTHVGLWGGGPKGEDLDVFCLDETVCVCHEEPKPSTKGWRHFLLTGLMKGSTVLQAALPSSGAIWATAKVEVVGKSGIKLIFFPGERRTGTRVLGSIYVIGGNGESIGATGGAEKGFTKAGDGGHTVEPTPPGHYTLGPKHHVTTQGWVASSIPWGAKLRVNEGEVEYMDDSGKGGWKLVTGPNGVMTSAYFRFHSKNGRKNFTIKIAEKEVRDLLIGADGKPAVSTWELNDFGRWGWNLRKNGSPTAFYIHTTPEDEATSAKGGLVKLTNSHGCIHLKPKDRDDFIAKGYLKEGVDIEVRPYSETGPL